MKPLAQNTLIQNRYLIVHLIGKGGMGEVYLSVDQRLGSAVALKRTFFAGDENLRAAFEREAKILARVRHPVLPKVSDHFGEGEEQYLVMEHISGDDLSKRLEVAGKPFPLSWVMFWADQLLDALSYLHSHEPPIIHRDIKPQNLKLTDENHIILLDFGLSKNSANMTNVSDSGSSSSGTGSIVGYTPHYAPMEQIRGIGTSPRSDIYALSATLYQLMTNEVPTDALTRADSLLNGLDDPIKPLHEINSEIPKEVSDVILKGMEVSQDKRFKDAREMQRVLRKAFSQMQSAMSAQTVAFNVSDAQNEKDVFASSPKPDNSIQANLDMSLGGSSISAAEIEQASREQEQPAQDFDATIQYNEPPADTSGEVRQADVKTEVFLAGSTPLAFPDEGHAAEDALPQIENDEYSQPDQYGQPETPVADDGAEDSPGGYSPEATVPLINFGGDAAPDAASFGAEEQPDPFATVTNAAGANEYGQADASAEYDQPYDQYDQQQADDGDEAAAVAPAAAASVAPKPAKKKRSKAGLFAVLGLGMFLLFAGAVGGGIWYVYNYHPEMLSIAGEEPTPEPTPETTPTPEETPLVAETNTDSNANTELANTDSNANIMVEPTPEPTVEVTSDRPRPQPTVRRTPRPRATPRKAPTPAPRRTPVFVQ